MILRKKEQEQVLIMHGLTAAAESFRWCGAAGMTETCHVAKDNRSDSVSRAMMSETLSPRILSRRRSSCDASTVAALVSQLVLHQ